METIYAEGTPLAAYLEGQGVYEPALDSEDELAGHHAESSTLNATPKRSYAPPSNRLPRPRLRIPSLSALQSRREPQGALERLHDAWSTAMYSRLRRADNARFIEHFRYIIVASQLLDDYLDQGSLQSHTVPTGGGFDAASEGSSIPSVSTSLCGAAATASMAFALVYLIHWARPARGGYINKSRAALALITFAVVGVVGYAYVRRQWLKFLRRNAVAAASGLTANWQAFELASSSALSLIQEVELVSKGYRLSTPLPPASRIEEQGTSRRCARLRRVLYKAYTKLLPACTEACDSLRTLINEDDLDKYYEVYDINPQDAEEAFGAHLSIESDVEVESLRSLRVLSYRSNVLRRVTLCSLMALEADGGKPDFARWRMATEIMNNISDITRTSAERIRQILEGMATLTIPTTPAKSSPHMGRDRLRGQVRKISALSSGIRGLQAKMQILREESNRCIEHSDELDLGPSMMAHYESIGADLRELVQAWETGKTSLQSNITKQERRISHASSASGLRSPVSSLGGLTMVEEGSSSGGADGSPADALRVLNGDVDKPSSSTHSSMATTPLSDTDDGPMVFEAVALPRQRSHTLHHQHNSNNNNNTTREERIAKMHEERERQAVWRAKRDASTSMLRELESVINLRPKRSSAAAAVPGGRITSL